MSDVLREELAVDVHPGGSRATGQGPLMTPKDPAPCPLASRDAGPEAPQGSLPSRACCMTAAQPLPACPHPLYPP